MWELALVHVMVGFILFAIAFLLCPCYFICGPGLRNVQVEPGDEEESTEDMDTMNSKQGMALLYK